MKVYVIGAALAAFASFGLSAQSTTRCTTVGNATNCETQPAPAPLDYGATLRASRELVPPITPSAPVYDPPYTAPARPRAITISTGNDLLSACEAADPSCLTYIRAASEGFAVAFDVAGAKRPYCMPEGVTAGQVQDIVVAWLKATPSDRHWPAAAIVAFSVMESYKCDR